MDSEAFSVWKKQFNHSMKLFEMVSDEEKNEALNHIKIKVADYEFAKLKGEDKITQNNVRDSTNGEYYEEHIKEEDKSEIKRNRKFSTSNEETETAPKRLNVDNLQSCQNNEEEIKAEFDSNEKSRCKATQWSALKPSDFYRKPVKLQVEELAAEQGLKSDYRFLKPAGYIYKLGQMVDVEVEGYEVCLTLTGDSTEEKFGGEDRFSPYGAIREASKKARSYLFGCNPP